MKKYKQVASGEIQNKGGRLSDLTGTSETKVDVVKEHDEAIE